MPGFFRAIWDAARRRSRARSSRSARAAPAYSFFTLPYLNMTVASDPESSWQVRLKGKTLKALAGRSIAYFGDHVELSDGRRGLRLDVRRRRRRRHQLRVAGRAGQEGQEAAPHARRARRSGRFWVRLYQEKRLSQGEYLGGLYDIGFDRPEAHAIRKGDSLYYAFYGDRFRGDVELRGLETRRYRVVDYENGRDLGTVDGPRPRVGVSFQGHLLLEARPE